MRSKQRISNFLDKVNWFELLHNQWNLFNSTWDTEIFVDKIEKRIPEIKKFWEENPDLKISQVLITLNIIPNKSGVWYYDEEYHLLMKQGIPPEECLFWTSIMDKDKKLLDEPITRLIKDMDKNHLKAIINDGYELSKEMKKAFNNVLNK